MFEDGTHIGVAACVKTVPYGDAHAFAVLLPAPSLLAFTDDEMLGLLAHEFLHIVQLTLDHDRNISSASNEELAQYSARYRASLSEYQSLDGTAQAAPSLWLNEHLRILADFSSCTDS
jgi:hypothetical protein